MTAAKEVAYDALQQMYNEAEPGLNFERLRRNPDEYPDDWISQHELSRQRQREIVELHCENAGLTQSERNGVFWSAILDYGPAYPDDDDGEPLTKLSEGGHD